MTQTADDQLNELQQNIEKLLHDQTAISQQLEGIQKEFNDLELPNQDELMRMEREVEDLAKEFGIENIPIQTTENVDLAQEIQDLEEYQKQLEDMQKQIDEINAQSPDQKQVEAQVMDYMTKADEVAKLYNELLAAHKELFAMETSQQQDAKSMRETLEKALEDRQKEMNQVEAKLKELEDLQKEFKKLQDERTAQAGSSQIQQ